VSTATVPGRRRLATATGGGVPQRWAGAAAACGDPCSTALTRHPGDALTCVFFLEGKVAGILRPVTCVSRGRMFRPVLRRANSGRN
jgi:hypothetical protein